MLAKDIMSEDIITVGPSMGVHELAELFIEKDISGVPVVDVDKKFLGIVHEEGVIFQDKKVHLPTFINISMGFLTLGVKKFEDDIKKITAQTVIDIMDKNPIIISPKATIEDVATMMIEKGISYFPVLENGNLMGVITKKDIVRAIAQGKGR